MTQSPPEFDWAEDWCVRRFFHVGGKVLDGYCDGRPCKVFILGSQVNVVTQSDRRFKGRTEPNAEQLADPSWWEPCFPGDYYRAMCEAMLREAEWPKSEFDSSW